MRMIALVVILAAALGAAVTVNVILLFLRSRSIRHKADVADRQITEARVEIFRDLQRLVDPPDPITRAGGESHEQPAGVNGRGPQPPRGGTVRPPTGHLRPP